VRVARLAGRLANAHGADARQARLAGMLHDLARLYPAERLVRECEERGLSIDAFERANPIVLHARLGAELAREEFGVRDDAVLSAIRLHTTAGPAMTRLDEIVYLADALEPGRDFAGRAELERLAFDDVTRAMRAVLAASTGYLRARGLAVAPATSAAIAHYASAALREERLSA
jgi:predicted HD superfamily hydrolase involved in NAD metabolism